MTDMIEIDENYWNDFTQETLQHKKVTILLTIQDY